MQTVYRWLYLEESELFVEEGKIEQHAEETAKHHAISHSKLTIFTKSMLRYWPRQLVASGAWLCNDFAFYGNKLQQNFFISLLYPDATLYKKMQWTLLNSFIALLGYYASAFFVDKPWFGRRVLQTQGFSESAQPLRVPPNLTLVEICAPLFTKGNTVSMANLGLYVSKIQPVKSVSDCFFCCCTCHHSLSTFVHVY